MNRRPLAIARFGGAILLALACLPAAAHSEAFDLDAAQLKIDRAALDRDLVRMGADQDRLHADHRAGRLAAESDDSYRVYQDRQSISGQLYDLSRDAPGSLQKTQDLTQLHQYRAELARDKARLRQDTAAGLEAALSPDAKRAADDRAAVRAAERKVAADEARLHHDRIASRGQPDPKPIIPT
jgi:hypothetical protein